MSIKTSSEIEILREGGHKLAAILERLKIETKPGVKTKDLDNLAEKLILEAGGEPSFKGYKISAESSSYPASLCISINDEVVHGLPSERRFQTGDIVGLDIGMKYQGLFTDMAQSIAVGSTDAIGEKLIHTARKSLELGIDAIKAGARVGDIGATIQNYVESQGFGVVRELVGHGVGHKVHEDPEVPNWGKAGSGPVLKESMVLALEPMVTEGGHEVYLDADGWTWRTKDGRRAAHFEHTVVVRKGGAEILTKIF